GLVTAVASGTVTVTATSEGKSGSFVLTVNPTPVATVTIVAPKTSFVVGDEAVTYTAVTKDAQGNVLTGRTVTWAVVQPGIVTGPNAGVVPAVARGTPSLTATSEGRTAAITVTVAANDAPSLLEQRILSQQGLAIALASTVLQTQLYTLIVVSGAD